MNTVEIEKKEYCQNWKKGILSKLKKKMLPKLKKGNIVDIDTIDWVY
jgi:hypothetical protein